MAEWNFGLGAGKDSMPLGKDTENFILENPQWVLYLRQDLRFPCPIHYEPSTAARKFDPRVCTTCWGTGTKINPLIVPSRIQLGTTVVGPTEGDFRLPPGYVERFFTAISFPRIVKPELEDLVAVCEWDKPTQVLGQYPRARILKIDTLYQIKQVNDYFERELSWYSCGIRTYDIDKKALDDVLYRLVNVRVLRIEDIRQNKKFW